MSKPATPGELNVFYLKAQDGIKDVVGDFTISSINIYFYFPKAWSARAGSGLLMLFI